MNSEQRKQQLIAQGALYRAHTLLAKERVRSSMRPAALAKGGLQGLAATAAAAYAGSGVASALVAKLPAFLPLALRAGALVASRKGLRKLLLGAAVAAAVAAGVSALLKRKRNASES